MTRCLDQIQEHPRQPRGIYRQRGNQSRRFFFSLPSDAFAFLFRPTNTVLCLVRIALDWQLVYTQTLFKGRGSWLVDLNCRESLLTFWECQHWLHSSIHEWVLYGKFDQKTLKYRVFLLSRGLETVDVQTCMFQPPKSIDTTMALFMLV